MIDIRRAFLQDRFAALAMTGCTLDCSGLDLAGELAAH
jgi:hypothetical protein